MKSLLPIFGLAALWAIAGAAVGAGIGALYGGTWVAWCSSLNVIVGLVLLLFVSRNPRARGLFYGDRRSDEQPAGMLVAVLWAFPFTLLFLGLLWLLLGRILQ